MLPILRDLTNAGSIPDWRTDSHPTDTELKNGVPYVQPSDVVIEPGLGAYRCMVQLQCVRACQFSRLSDM